MTDCSIHTSDIARRQHLRSAGCRQLFVPRHRRSSLFYGRPGDLKLVTFEIRHVLLTVFVVTSKLFFSRSTSVHSALEALRLCAIQIYY